METIGAMEPLLIPRSYLTTESNKTGSWRFLRPRYQEKTAPCSAACPAGEDIGRIEMLTARGLFQEAWETILKENPFPAVCGRVCFHPCEDVCNRKEFDDAVAIQTLERCLADNAARHQLQPSLECLSPKPEKIAVVGAGPGGLAASYFLARLGYACDIFEAASEPGGVLRWGIPLYRLPVATLQQEISRIEALGVRIHCGETITRRLIDEVRSRYQAIFLGCGHARSGRLGIPGEDLAGVEDGLEFLHQLRSGSVPSLAGTVAVVGGGNTAIDVARTVVRLGGQALLIYRRRVQDMPAFPREVRMAREEGVEMRELWAPERIELDPGGLLLTLRAMRMTHVDEAGRAQVEPEPDKTQVIPVQRIFRAIGAGAAEAWYEPPANRHGRRGPEPKLKSPQPPFCKGGQEGSYSKRDEVLTLNSCVLVSQPHGPVLAFGGDLVNPVKSVVHAVASGKEAAMALDVLFREGPAAIEPKLQAALVGGGPAYSMEVYLKGLRCRRDLHVVRYDEINTDYFQFAPRIVPPRLLREERSRSFAEIDLRISAGMAVREAERCFNCGLCNQCDNCRLFCPDLAVTVETNAAGRHINYDYCKGCGICVVECPRNAMVLEQEPG
jgi:NADPH-dependent glutamate synthase beta subunit-like oxidoreductase/Pyruvate/2-oxoacid:ferredoxin oxidoreductase delta subunit